MAQFSGRRGGSWAWIVIAILLAAVLILAYLWLTQPSIYTVA